eukprot:COSAG01_NODE_51923_length_350_cov_7.135458_1_plen_81_part_10
MEDTLLGVTLETGPGCDWADGVTMLLAGCGLLLLSLVPAFFVWMKLYYPPCSDGSGSESGSWQGSLMGIEQYEMNGPDKTG